MGESALAVTIADSPDARNVGAKLIVDLNVSVGIDRHSGLFESQVVGIGASPDREQQVRAAGVRGRTSGVEAHNGLIAHAAKALTLRTKANLDAFALQNIQNRGGH